MNKNILKLSFLLFAFNVFLYMPLTVQAKENTIIKKGVFIAGMDMSDKTKEEARLEIEEYIANLLEVEINLITVNGNTVMVTPKELGIYWNNEEVLDEALTIGTKGNIIQRYKQEKDIENGTKNYNLTFDYDIELINNILTTKCEKFNQPAKNVSLERTNGTFTVIEGKQGYTLDVEQSIDVVYNYLKEEWNHSPSNIELAIDVEESKGSAEELAEVRDVLGTFTTAYKSSGSARVANVANGSKLINGATLYPGEEFSTYNAVAPFTQSNGYHMAGSFANGKLVDSLGGGICQVSTTLYNAVLRAELDITERHNHSMIVSYVDPSADAAIAESAGKDFRFVNNTEAPIYIESSVENKTITITIFGKETRNANRKVTYESEVLEVIQPTTDNIYANASQPIGYIVTESAYIGYKAKLWKVEKIDGVEVSRTQVNSSNYKMVPRSASVGTVTADPSAYEEIMAAIGTGSIDHVKNVIGILTTQVSAGNAPTENAPTENAQ